MPFSFLVERKSRMCSMGAGGSLVVERIPCLLLLANVRYKQLQSYLIKLEVQMKEVPHADTAAVHGFL